MCTLIYWAKLVPLRHINIDEGGEEALEVSLKTPVLELGCFELGQYLRRGRRTEEGGVGGGVGVENINFV